MSACKSLILLLSVVGVCYLASPVASEQNCSVENCKVLPVGEDLESEFRLNNLLESENRQQQLQSTGPTRPNSSRQMDVGSIN